MRPRRCAPPVWELRNACADVCWPWIPPGWAGSGCAPGSGPVRDRMAAALAALPLPPRRLHPEIGDAALFGGVDVAATLAAGHPVISRGILADPATLILAMAERAGPGLAARLGAAMDGGAGHCLVALDEAAEEGEGLAPALAERLAFRADLDGIALADAPPPEMDGDAHGRSAGAGGFRDAATRCRGRHDGQRRPAGHRQPARAAVCAERGPGGGRARRARHRERRRSAACRRAGAGAARHATARPRGRTATRRARAARTARPRRGREAGRRRGARPLPA
jgi:hypothetical protein